MARALALMLAVLILGTSGCTTTAPAPPPPTTQRLTMRDTTLEERETISRLLLPLLITAGIWTKPADGCAAAIGILQSQTINLGVGLHATCKFLLGITEGALAVLSQDELRAALAHEVGHVQLGHLEARKARRAAEKHQREGLGNTTGAVAVPVIGPIVGLGVVGAQAVTDMSVAEQYRSYDREEELAADRYGYELLELVIGRARACQAEVGVLDRLAQGAASRPWAAWINTHPKPADRLKIARELCPG